jgi:pyruvate dehydrogenase complex dehydrogenase (E1) component
MKKMTIEDLIGFRDRLDIPVKDEAIDAKLPPYFHPGKDSAEYQYMMDRRVSWWFYSISSQSFKPAATTKGFNL